MESRMSFTGRLEMAACVALARKLTSFLMGAAIA